MFAAGGEVAGGVVAGGEVAGGFVAGGEIAGGVVSLFPELEPVPEVLP